MPSTFRCQACSTARCCAPVEGAAPQAFDEAKVTAIKGVVKVVQLPYGIGVVADTPWVAFAARREIG